VNSDEFFKAKLLALVGKEIPVSDPLLENEGDDSRSAIRGGFSDTEREELLRYEEQLKIEKAVREDKK